MMDYSGTIVLIMACLLLEGLFSGGEIALIAADINKIRYRANQGSRSAALVMKLLEKPEWFFATTLIGTDLCIIIESSLATSLFISIFGIAEGQFISALIMVPIILVFGEIIPKSLFQQKAESVSMRISWFINAASWLLYPLVFVISRISRSTVSLFRGEKTGGHFSYITMEGLKFLLRQKEDFSTDVRSSEKEMVRRILDFSSETVSDVMVPLSNLKALEKQTSLKDATVLLKGKWFSRIPIYDKEIFNIIGVLHVFDLLRVLPDESDETVGKYARTPVFYIPETKRASELLIEMQKKGIQIAVAVDEYGGAVGVVTIEDLLEEIVGEIEDEYDQEKRYRRVEAGRYIFEAGTKIENIRELMHIEIPEGNYETLGGFLLAQMGRIPRKGERLKRGDVLYVIQDADAKSIKEVLVIVQHEISGTNKIERKDRE